MSEGQMRELPTSAKLNEAHALYEEHPLMHKAVGMVRLAQHRATRKATLEEVRNAWEVYGPSVGSRLFVKWLTAQLEADDGKA